MDVYVHTVSISPSSDKQQGRVGIRFPSSMPRGQLLKDLVDFMGAQFPRGLDRIGTTMFGMEWSISNPLSLTLLEASAVRLDELLQDLDTYDLEADEYYFSLGCHLSNPEATVEEVVPVAKKHVAKWSASHPPVEPSRLRSLSRTLSPYYDPVRAIEDNMQYWNPLCSQWDYTTYKTLTNDSESIAVPPRVIKHCADPEFREFLNVITRIPTFFSTAARDRVLGDISISEVEDRESQSYLANIPLHYPDFRSYIKSLTVEQLYRRYPIEPSLRSVQTDLPHQYTPELQARETARKRHLEAIEELILGKVDGEISPLTRQRPAQISSLLCRFAQDTYFLEALRAHLETDGNSLDRLHFTMTSLCNVFLPNTPSTALLSAPLDYVSMRLTQLSGDPKRTFEIIVESGSLGGDIDTWEAYFSAWESLRDTPASIALELLST